MAFTLDNIVPWGRSGDEYRAMFALTASDLEQNILGCGDGPASFNAEMARAGRKILSVDPIYAFSVAEIETRIATTFSEILRQLEQSREDYLWERFKDPAQLGTVRMAAMRNFLDDFPQGKTQGRYLAAELPELPFADRQFDLALCSHLLFLYSEQLSLDFHRAAILELCRVAAEVRIFPLVTLAGRPSPHLATILAELKERGFRAQVEKVTYEFQRGGNEMLRICR